MRSIEEIADQVLQALRDGDLSAFEELLDPDVTWEAAVDGAPHCRNRTEVLAWYEQSLAAGVRSRVTEIQVAESRILLALEVRGRTAEAIERWQVLEVRDGHIVEIVGFDDRGSATNRARRGEADGP